MRLLDQSMAVLLIIQGKCSHLGSKPAHLVRHLPRTPNKSRVLVNDLRFEFCVQGSIKQEFAGLEPLQEPELRCKEWKPVLPLLREK